MRVSAVDVVALSLADERIRTAPAFKPLADERLQP